MADVQYAELERLPRVTSEIANARPILERFSPALPPSVNLAGFLRAAFDIADVLRTHGFRREAGQVDAHLRYLAAKARTEPDSIRAGEPFGVHPQVVVDAVQNITAVIAAASDAQSRSRPAGDSAVPAGVMELIEAAERQLQGWCSRQKSLAIVSAVLDLRPEVCVEIGVYGGRSAVPCAAALRHLGQGVLYGVESWSPAVAVEHPTTPVNDAWWSNLDLGSIKENFFRFVVEQGLTRQIRIVEAPSARAHHLFGEIDFLHIDGAHSVVNAAEDVILYAQKVRRGGIVVFDDVNWATTAPAMGILQSLCETVEELTDPATGKPLCAFLRRL
ncbi:class I SAM-dependent methyltransferase [Muricoccus radiodurans]|uniref:class I SAM-dependent methyltransferase n=1 Tax=Muricoccus radiodurans TaxID=2231721 RepID=UPI003CE9BCB1